MADQQDDRSTASTEDEDAELSPTVIIGVVGALIVVTVLIFTLFGGSDEDGGGDEPVSLPPPAPAAGPGPAGTVPPATTTPEIKEVTGLPAGAPTDDFDRADDATSPGAAWQTTGTWGIVDGTLANLPTEGETGRRFALRDPGAADVTVAAVLIESFGGTGIVFRYQDDQNYWLLSPARRYATWVLHKYQDGEATLVGNTGQRSSAENTSVVIDARGASITVTIDGKDPVTFEDGYLSTATQAGFAAGAAQGARWDSFYAVPAG